jgi:hypothetical protein
MTTPPHTLDDVRQYVNRYIPPTLHLSYDRISQSISANFSKPANRDLTSREEGAMKLFAERFFEQSNQFLYEAVNQKTLEGLKYLCQSIIDQVYAETGVKINLDTTGIDQFVGQSRFGYYGY